MNAEFEDELEFFSFLPSEFHLDVCQMLERLLSTYVAEQAPSARGEIDAVDTAVQKNMLIFERFTLRNIFTFPESFVYDRRATPEVPVSPEKLRSKILSVCLQKETLAAAKEAHAQKKRAAAELEGKLKQLKEMPALEGITQKLESLNILVKQVRDLKKKYILSMPQTVPPKKELEEEIRSKECQSLEKRIPLDILTNLEALLASEE
ncbi:hypothetical protein NECID01_0772 [Nematocida sp. AWRm77]|nr:hypothetical protein NECID01_0772 [Nematocida sp. AWRm77]